MDIKLTQNEISIIIMCLNSNKFYNNCYLEDLRQTVLSKLIDECEKWNSK